MLRRQFLTAALLAPVTALAATLPSPPMGPDGMFVEEWFRPTTGDLRKDLTLAAGEGKVLALFWESAGCEWCQLLHLEALRDSELRRFPAQRFYSVRLDRFGSGRITDFDGISGRESEIAERMGVIGTPTFSFRIANGREVLRLPGYAEPPVLLAAFEYVEFGAWAQTSFASWLQRRGLL
jgi:thioredoxin-related protein